MKQQKIIIICLTTITVLTILAVVAIKSVGIGSRIALPSAENVVAIEMYQNESWTNQTGLIRITEQRDIDAIIAALFTARQTSFSWYSAANEAPSQSNYLTVSVYTGEDTIFKTLHLYGGETVYAVYTGIYRMNKLEYEEIQSIYTALTI